MPLPTGTVAELPELLTVVGAVPTPSQPVVPGRCSQYLSCVTPAAHARQLAIMAMQHTCGAAAASTAGQSSGLSPAGVIAYSLLHVGLASQYRTSAGFRPMCASTQPASLHRPAPSSTLSIVYVGAVPV